MHIGGHVTQPIACAEDKIWLTDDVELPPVGTPVRQSQLIGDTLELLQIFTREWTKRWDRHANVPHSEWAPITNFYRLAVPPKPRTEFPPITVELWQQTLKRKKARSASGPDVWSRKDLLMLPSDLTAAIIAMLHEIEMGAPWPPQIVLGLVFSLEKTHEACRVEHYRPITIFSLIYRTWTSIRAKQSLKYLAPLAPTRCFGNLPSKSATQVWFGIQTALEESYHTITPAAGVVDIEKCFNHLPRLALRGDASMDIGHCNHDQEIFYPRISKQPGAQQHRVR